MSSRRSHSNESRNKGIKLILICLVVFLFGLFLLEYISTLEKPPLGAIFNIILGCILMAVSTLFIILTIKKMFFTKKKRSKSRQIFLKDQQRNSDVN